MISVRDAEEKVILLTHVGHFFLDAINVFQGANHQENAPIRVSYHQKTHYNSVVDPYAATIGVGLGMPNFQPGVRADQKVFLLKDRLTFREFQFCDYHRKSCFSCSL
jgi:hypothetical protein